ncbi:hypothetical protein NL676_026246 [Syzygium grande]|nr:hypothetical protein NL676_026246 [Syzygium grande]
MRRKYVLNAEANHFTGNADRTLAELGCDAQSPPSPALPSLDRTLAELGCDAQSPPSPVATTELRAKPPSLGGGDHGATIQLRKGQARPCLLVWRRSGPLQVVVRQGVVDRHRRKGGDTRPSKSFFPFLQDRHPSF